MGGNVIVVTSSKSTGPNSNNIPGASILNGASESVSKVARSGVSSGGVAPSMTFPSITNPLDDDLNVTQVEKPGESIANQTRGILSRLTPENVDELKEDISKLRERLREAEGEIPVVISIIFEKVFDKPSSSQIFAKMLKLICQSSQQLDMRFQRQILDHCRQEFRNIHLDKNEMTEKESEIEEMQDVEEKMELKVEFQNFKIQRMRKRRRKSLGIAQLIGELLEVHIFTAKVVIGFIQMYLGNDDEENYESLAVLLTTAGQTLETILRNQTERLRAAKTRGLPVPVVPDGNYVDKVFQKLKHVKMTSKLSFRVRLALHNLIELRGNTWLRKLDCRTPETSRQITALETSENGVVVHQDQEHTEQQYQPALENGKADEMPQFTPPATSTPFAHLNKSSDVISDQIIASPREGRGWEQSVFNSGYDDTSRLPPVKYFKLQEPKSRKIDYNHGQCCLAKFCRNKRKKLAGRISFFTVRKEWVNLISLCGDIKPALKNWRICELHFHRNEIRHLDKKRVKEGVMPTLYMSDQDSLKESIDSQSPDVDPNHHELVRQIIQLDHDYLGGEIIAGNTDAVATLKPSSQFENATNVPEGACVTAVPDILDEVEGFQSLPSMDSNEYNRSMKFSGVSEQQEIQVYTSDAVHEEETRVLSSQQMTKQIQSSTMDRQTLSVYDVTNPINKTPRTIEVFGRKVIVLSPKELERQLKGKYMISSRMSGGTQIMPRKINLHQKVVTPETPGLSTDTSEIYDHLDGNINYPVDFNAADLDNETFTSKVVNTPMTAPAKKLAKTRKLCDASGFSPKGPGSKEYLEKKIKALKNNYRAAQARERRLKEALKRKKLEFERATQTCREADFGFALNTLMDTEHHAHFYGVKSQGIRYCDDMKKFACNLYSCSAKAYSYMQESISSMPHPRTVYTWVREDWKNKNHGQDSIEGNNIDNDDDIRTAQDAITSADVNVHPIIDNNLHNDQGHNVTDTAVDECSTNDVSQVTKKILKISRRRLLASKFASKNSSEKLRILSSIKASN